MIQTLYPQFQRWSERGAVLLISDTHFDDEDRNLMGYNIDEDGQIERLKRVVGKYDTLIHLGDVGNPKYLNALKCHKVLIMGNHDESATKFQPYFNEIYTGPLWIADKIVLSHEPLNIYSSATNNPVVYNIHGHLHNGEPFYDNCHLNIAQNIFGWYPLNLKFFIREGYLKNINDIHRETIDFASQNGANK